VYLHDTEVVVDVQKITVREKRSGVQTTLILEQNMGVKCVGVNGAQEKRFDSECVQDALRDILAEVV
jgi:hypothetical protein